MAERPEDRRYPREAELDRQDNLAFAVQMGSGFLFGLGLGLVEWSPIDPASGSLQRGYSANSPLGSIRV
jgi:hypothetical protein